MKILQRYIAVALLGSAGPAPVVIAQVCPPPDAAVKFGQYQARLQQVPKTSEEVERQEEIAQLVKAIKTLRAYNEALEKRVEELESENKTLKAQLTAAQKGKETKEGGKKNEQ